MAIIRRICQFGKDGREIPIYLDLDPSVCKWIIVTCGTGGPPADPVQYVVSFLRPDGSEIDFAARDTLQEALDTAAILSNSKNLQWRTSNCPMPADGDLKPLDLERILEEGRESPLTEGCSD